MRIVLLTLLSALLAGSLYATDSTGQSKLASDMRTMLSAMVDVQRAGYYLNKSGVKEGADRLIKSLDSLLTTDPASYLPGDKADAGRFAKKREQMLKLYAEELILAVENEDTEEAMNNYSLIINECTSCHSRIRNRKWK
jgi:cytochrome c556